MTTRMLWKYSQPENDPAGNRLVVSFMFSDHRDTESFNLTPTDRYFDKAVKLVTSGDADPDEVRSLVNLNEAIVEPLRKISKRISIVGNTVLFDGRKISDTISEVVLNFAEAGQKKELKRVVRFLKRIERNPSAESRENLYSWMDHGNLRFDADGFLIAYKGVQRVGGKLLSAHSGTASVDGVEYKDQQIPNEVGTTITMPRSKVNDNSAIACSTGLHFGTMEYASSFAQVLISVRVDPKDVVAVPNDTQRQKVRCVKYTVLEVMEDRSYGGLVYGSEDVERSEDESFYEDEYEETFGDDDAEDDEECTICGGACEFGEDPDDYEEVEEEAPAPVTTLDRLMARFTNGSAS